MDNTYSGLHIPQKDLIILRKYAFLNKLTEAMEEMPKDRQYTSADKKLVDDVNNYFQKVTSSQNENPLESTNLKNIPDVEEKSEHEYDKNSSNISPKDQDFMNDFFKEHKILSENRLMLSVFKKIIKFRKRAKIVITGEPGTGKEGIAHAIHKLSGRTGKIVALNMASSSESLEGDLFGHKKGAFTDAFETVIGGIKVAHKGTLFLDEIGDIPEDIQGSMLRALQEKKVKMRGDITEESVDFRLITATNKDLSHCIETEKIREDFYYRIKGVRVHLPPLNDRRSDIPILANYFFNTSLSSLKNQAGSDSKFNDNLKISPSDFNILSTRDWSGGNVRDLKTEVENVADAYFGCLEEGLKIDRNMFHKIINDPYCDIDEIQSPNSILSDDETNCVRLLIQKEFNILKVAENVHFGRDKVNSIINNSLLKLGSSYEYETKAIAISLTDILKIEKFNENEKLSKEINSRFIRIIEHHRPQPKIYSNDLNTNVEDLIQVRKNFIPV